MLVIQIEVINVAGAVVAIHNVPGEGDVGPVPTGPLEVANMTVLGSCTATKRKGMGGMHSVYRIFSNNCITQVASYVFLPVSDAESRIPVIKRNTIFTALVSTFRRCVLIMDQSF